MATSPFCSDAFVQRALKSDAQCQGTKGDACLWLQLPTELPFRLLVAYTHVALQSLETLDSLREATVLF